MLFFLICLYRFLVLKKEISPMIRSPLDLSRLERFEEPPHFGPTCDLLWSDPMDESTVKDKAKFEEEYFQDNEGRGCGQLFGPAAVKGLCLSVFKNELESHGVFRQRLSD